ncbi:MAG: toprim domain-containing protein, partial [Acidobacteria bacterium]|nr:toprim domain-containing protein [Acidobacteriota bacterium]
PLLAYFQGRGLSTNNLPEAIRYHPALPYFVQNSSGKSRKLGDCPACVALVSDRTGNPTALLRIYLTRDGRKAEVPHVKKALGPIKGCAIRLDPAVEILNVTEGLETALAVRQATALPTWSLISTSGMSSAVIPHSIREIHIWADDDAARQRAARQLAGRLRAEGRSVFLHLPPQE